MKKKELLPYIRSNFERISQREIARRLKIGKTTVNRWSREEGLIHKNHTANERFFDSFNEHSTYILGLIMADGNISWNENKSYWAMTLTAASKDRSHLEKIRGILSSSKPLIYSPKTNSYRLIVNSKYLCKRLMNLGILPRKTLTARFPNIPNNQLRHFIRGVIDGDGNVRYVQRKRSPYFEITIASGSIDFCEDFRKVILHKIGINANIRKVGKNVYVLQYSCSRGKKLAQYVYDGATIFLERKQKIYDIHIGGKTK
ncbi:hypothetical protein GOV09_06495 [Candidatus Woesearchaeota archaeon]|nr:hypothetical protein [Candidatus Woesearchaeota archaeon]